MDDFGDGAPHSAVWHDDSCRIARATSSQSMIRLTTRSSDEVRVAKARSKTTPQGISSSGSIPPDTPTGMMLASRSVANTLGSSAQILKSMACRSRVGLL